MRSLRILALILAVLLGAGPGAAAPAAAVSAAGAAQAAAEAQAPVRIPAEALQVLAYVRDHGEAPPGHVGGRRFGNYEGRLPKLDARGRPIAYREWDIFPKRPGRSRGQHRLVTGGDGRAWYTADHYRTFTEIRGRR